MLKEKDLNTPKGDHMKKQAIQEFIKSLNSEEAVSAAEFILNTFLVQPDSNTPTSKPIEVHIDSKKDSND